METLAKMYIHVQVMGEPPHLPAAVMDRVIEHVRRMGYGQAPDLDHVEETPWAPAG